MRNCALNEQLRKHLQPLRKNATSVFFYVRFKFDNTGHYFKRRTKYFYSIYNSNKYCPSNSAKKSHREADDRSTSQNFPFMLTESSLPCSQKPATEPQPQQYESSPHPMSIRAISILPRPRVTFRNMLVFWSEGFLAPNRRTNPCQRCETDYSVWIRNYSPFCI
jgi:hypothetical protein